MKGLILYTRDDCPFSGDVIAEAEKLGIELELRDISNPTIADELIERGGKKQTPYLVDVENAIELYEADNIITYLQDNYSDAPALDIEEDTEL